MKRLVPEALLALLRLRQPAAVRCRPRLAGLFTGMLVELHGFLHVMLRRKPFPLLPGTAARFTILLVVLVSTSKHEPAG